MILTTFGLYSQDELILAIIKNFIYYKNDIFSILYDGFKELLRNLLCLNPYFRWSINECLQSPVFDNIRSEQLESSATHKIKLEVDNDDAFDYEDGKSYKFTRKDYILLLLSESEEIHA